MEYKFYRSSTEKAQECVDKQDMEEDERFEECTLSHTSGQRSLSSTVF